MATLVAPEQFSPVADAEAIRNAVQGLGTDEKAIISILGHRNAAQRKLIRNSYEEIYQEDLVNRLESELSGEFEARTGILKMYNTYITFESEVAKLGLWGDLTSRTTKNAAITPSQGAELEKGCHKMSDCLESMMHKIDRAVYRWILDPADRDAVLANVAINQSTIDFRVIVELSCIYSPEELLAVKRAYQARYHHSLEEDLAARTSGDLRKLLVALMGIYRYDGDEINARLAYAEAQNLHYAIKQKFDHDAITRIVGTRSKAQLMATFNCYKDYFTNSISKHLADDAENQYVAAACTAIKCINDPRKYYEKVLQSALNKPGGTDKDALTRVIVTRAEKDLKDIKDLYYKRRSVSLDDAVAEVTSGDYKAFLLALLGKEN